MRSLLPKLWRGVAAKHRIASAAQLRANFLVLAATAASLARVCRDALRVVAHADTLSLRLSRHKPVLRQYFQNPLAMASVNERTTAELCMPFLRLLFAFQFQNYVHVATRKPNPDMLIQHDEAIPTDAAGAVPMSRPCWLVSLST
jgi:hypothetical protein